jgi:hypothetical protein
VLSVGGKSSANYIETPIGDSEARTALRRVSIAGTAEAVLGLLKTA